jgi:hypothetical protein
VLVVDATRLAQLAADHRIGRSTAYCYLHEAIDGPAAAAPALRCSPPVPPAIRTSSWTALRSRPIGSPPAPSAGTIGQLPRPHLN